MWVTISDFDQHEINRNNMSYHTKTKQIVRTAHRTLGVRLAKLAIIKGLSVQQIALLTGASRTTVYSWFAGRGVTNAYRPIVNILIRRLRDGSKEQIMELKMTKEPIPPMPML